MGTKKSDLTKKKILDAARDQFSQKGLYGARVDEIASQANINKRMLYEYFGNKEDLYQIVLESVYDSLNEQEALVFSDPIECIPAFRQIISMYFRFLQNNEAFVRMLMWENLQGARHLNHDAFGGIRDVMVQSISSLLETGKKDGIIRKDADDEQVVLTLISCCFNYFSNIHTLSKVLHTDLSSEDNILRRIEHVTRMVLQYIVRDGVNIEACLAAESSLSD